MSAASSQTQIKKKECDFIHSTSQTPAHSKVFGEYGMMNG